MDPNRDSDIREAARLLGLLGLYTTDSGVIVLDDLKPNPVERTRLLKTLVLYHGLNQLEVMRGLKDRLLFSQRESLAGWKGSIYRVTLFGASGYFSRCEAEKLVVQSEIGIDIDGLRKGFDGMEARAALYPNSDGSPGYDAIHFTKDGDIVLKLELWDPCHPSSPPSSSPSASPESSPCSS